VSDYLILFAIVFGVNLMPAFGPPTWTIIVLYGLNSQLSVPVVVVVAALAAASGRLFLAHAFRLFGDRLPVKMRRNLQAAQRALQRRKRNMILALGLFALSPLPSAQLFEAAGLTRVSLVPFTAAFFGGRIVSYSIYAVTAAGIRETSVGETFRASFTSPVGLAIQIAMIGLLVLLVRIDWARRLGSG
jgi:uncharacterized membrane protein YdjX (TVP38/TMEM64 family)